MTFEETSPIVPDTGNELVDKGISVTPITRNFAESHMNRILELLREIPEAQYDEKYVLSEKRFLTHNGQREYYTTASKWKHSLALMDGDKLIGLAIGYERPAEPEGDDHNSEATYPIPTFHIADVVVDSAYRSNESHIGLSRSFFTTFLERVKEQKGSFENPELNKNLVFSAQTMIGDSNRRVQQFMGSFGFRTRGIRKGMMKDQFVLFTHESGLNLPDQQQIPMISKPSE